MNRIITLDEFIIHRQKDFPYASGELTGLLRDIGVAAKIVKTDDKRQQKTRQNPRPHDRHEDMPEGGEAVNAEKTPLSDDLAPSSNDGSLHVETLTVVSKPQHRFGGQHFRGKRYIEARRENDEIVKVIVRNDRVCFFMPTKKNGASKRRTQYDWMCLNMIEPSNLATFLGVIPNSLKLVPFSKNWFMLFRNEQLVVGIEQGWVKEFIMLMAFIDNDLK